MKALEASLRRELHQSAALLSDVKEVELTLGSFTQSVFTRTTDCIHSF